MHLTVLTRPVRAPFGFEREHLVKAIQESTRRLLGRRPPEFSGHPAVTRSLVHGLRAVGADFNFNPATLAEVGEVVHVPGGHLALRQAIRLKRAGRIRRLLAGPNLVELPSDHPSLVGAPELDVLIVNCNWVRQMYISEMPQLADHCEIWPAGVDVSFWESRQVAADGRRLLFYAKNAPDDLIADCAAQAAAAGFDVSFLRYGRYSARDYRAALARAGYLVYFSAWESQGIAISEAWACDVPSLVWNPGYVLLKGKTYQTSAAPYLTEHTGRFFGDSAGLGRLLRSELQSASFAPRQWVLENMSDEVCARALLRIATHGT